MPTVIISHKDIAGMTILNQLRKIRSFTIIESEITSKSHQLLKTSQLSQDQQYHVLIIENNLLEADFVEMAWKDDFYIFLSKHSAKSGMPSLTVHFTGNWGNDAVFGGKPRELSVTHPDAARHAFLRIQQFLKQDEFSSLPFRVTYEVTHHGPLLKKTPSFFLELGSEAAQWKDEKAARIIAIVADEIARGLFDRGSPSFLGVGGTHYAEKFNKIVTNTSYACAHLIPKYSIKDLKPVTFSQALNRNPSPLSAIIIDHSGTNSKQRQHLKELLEHVSDPPPILRAKDILKK